VRAVRQEELAGGSEPPARQDPPQARPVRRVIAPCWLSFTGGVPRRRAFYAIDPSVDACEVTAAETGGCTSFEADGRIRYLASAPVISLGAGRGGH